MCTEKGSNFLRNADVIAEDDTVIVYVNPSTQYNVIVKRGNTLHMKYGALRHEFLIGKRYGTAISATAGYVYVLRVNSDMWTRTLQKKTQILYTPDIGIILLLLDVKPGSKICETGTGSGSLSHAIATAIAPSGHLFSYDIDEQRLNSVRVDMMKHGLSQNTSIELRDVCKEGFSVEDCCDSVFLDLPAPWLSIGHAKKALNKQRRGRLVSFSPCIEQVKQVCLELEQQAFVEIETLELVPQKMKVIDVSTESLFEFAAQGSNAPTSIFRSVEEQISRNSIKRKRTLSPIYRREEVGVRVDSDEKVLSKGSDHTIDDRLLLDAIEYPFCQPTHTGYITSATLLPSFVNNV